MRNLIYQIRDVTLANLSIPELFLLSVLAVIAWRNRKERPWFPTLACIFLILYITLLRRTPGYTESIRLRLKLGPSAGIWAGNLLNLVLYIPFGAAGWTWKRDWKKTAFAGLSLSIFCELMQRLTGRGMADVNDVLFNTLGAVMGIYVIQKLSKQIKT